MPRRRREVNSGNGILEHVIHELKDDAIPTGRKLEIMHVLRSQSPEGAKHLDECLLLELERCQVAIRASQDAQENLRMLHQSLTAEPWYQAIVREVLPVSPRQRILVIYRGESIVVGVAPEVEASSLRAGDVVFLGSQRNLIVEVAPEGHAPGGEVARFESRMPDGRVILRSRGQDRVVVGLADRLDEVPFKDGDLVRWDRGCGLAFEKLPRTRQTRFLLDELPDVRSEQLGGQCENRERLLAALTVSLVSPDLATLYGLNGRQTVLLVGPPGCGKTMLARIAASELGRRSGRKCRFAVVKPGEFESPYVGETQQKMRDCFASLRQAAEDQLIVVFLDEIEAIGRIRGGFTSHHSDKFLAALLAELDGFESRSNIAVIAATNRKDLIDPALLERLSDIELVVTRPDMSAARAIFDVHMPDTVPYHANGSTADGMRREMIDTAVARLYCPNSAGHALCELRFRDGKTRTVTAGELMSGRVIEQICRAARQRALWREVKGGNRGLCAADIDEAVVESLERLGSTLTRANVHAYLADLPQDLDVVSVEPVVRRVRNPGAYLNVA